MRFGIVGTVLFLILPMLLPGLASGATPSDYDECILESMKGVKSDLAAKSIIRSCRNKFPEELNKKPNENLSTLQGRLKELKPAMDSYHDWMTEARKLNPDSTDDELTAYYERKYGNKNARTLTDKEMSQLIGRAGFYRGNFSGRIHNGNANITISKITIQITTTIGGKEVAELYRDDVTIEPQTTEFFMFEALRGDKDANYSWGINSARGY